MIKRMKFLKLLPLVCTFFLFSAQEAGANSFSDLYLTVTLDETGKQEIPDNMPLVDLTESGEESTFILHGFTVRTAAAATSVAMQYRIYKSGAAGAGWAECSAMPGYDGASWSYSSDTDLLQGLETGGTYILEFRIKGVDEATGNEFYYDNGGANYQLKFAVGQPWSVRFKPGLNTAVMQLQSDDKIARYAFPSEQTWGGVQLGTVSDLRIRAFGVNVECSVADAEISSVRMAYKFYPLGGNGKSWYYLDAENTGGGNERTYTNFEGIDLISAANEKIAGGLQEGQAYVFEIRYEMKAGGKEYRLSGSDGGFKFIFTYNKDAVIGNPDGFKWVSMLCFMNGQEVKLSMSAEGTEMIDLAVNGGTNWELSIGEVRMETNVPADYVAMKYRIYEDGAEAGQGWKELIAYSNDGEGRTWSCSSWVDLLSGLEKGKTYIAECYFTGVAKDGSPFEYNNGGGNYKMRFTVAPDSPDFKDLQLLISVNGDEDQVQLPFAGMPVADLVEDEDQDITWELTLNSWSVQTVEAATSVVIMSRVYKSTAPGGEWREVKASSTDGIHWACASPISATDGLEKNETYIWEFYMKATNAKGDVFYNNGGENYKVKFLYGDKQQEQENVEFVGYNGESSFVMLAIDDNEPLPYYLPDLKNMHAYADGALQLGTVSSISLQRFEAYLWRSKADIEITSVSLQYKLYEQGSSGMWNRIESEALEDLNDEYTLKRYFSYTPHPFSGLESGKSYILEVMLQAQTENGNYYFLTDNEESSDNVGFKFAFTYDPDTSGVAGITADGKGEGPSYNLNGTEVNGSYRGITVEKGKKILRK